MKRLTIFTAALLFFLLAIPLGAFAGEFEVGFEWDKNTEAFCNGYRLYSGEQAGGPYVAVTDIEGRSTNEVYWTFIAADGVETTLYFVVTALATNGMVSGYSNEVNFTFDFRVMEPANTLTAELQDDDILFRWAQPAIERVKTWGLYRSETSGGPYEKLLDITYTGQAGPQYSEIVSMPVPDGEIKTYFFVLITRSDQGVLSIDSNEVTVVIDKRIIGPVFNFKIKTISQ